MSALIPGLATAAATCGKDCAPGHFSDFPNRHLQLSSRN